MGKIRRIICLGFIGGFAGRSATKVEIVNKFIGKCHVKFMELNHLTKL